jgi:hypothetical protein
MTTLIRPRAPGDIAECVEVLRQVHDADRYPTRWPRDPHRFVAPPYEQTAWVAVEEGSGQRPFLNVATHLQPAVRLYQEDWENLGPVTIAFPNGVTLGVLVFLGPAPGRSV